MSIRKNLVRLEPLDITKSTTVGQILLAMSKCAIGARMLGEVAETFHGWITDGHGLPIIVCDLPNSSLVRQMLNGWQQKGWVRTIMSPEEYINSCGIPGWKNRVLLVDFLSMYQMERIRALSVRLICVNQYGIAPKGQTRDGFFPNVVFSDPNFVIPALNAYFVEMIEKVQISVPKFLNTLDSYEGLASETVQGANILRSMIRNPECTVFMTLSGPMSVAQMSLVLCEMIERRYVDFLSTTGAFMAHGLVGSIGLEHYKYDPTHDDSLLAQERINRITDTLEPEENFDAVEQIVDKVLDDWDDDEELCSSSFHAKVGKYLSEEFPSERGILKSAHEKGVPVVVPAFWDSEVGNDFFIHNKKRRLSCRKSIVPNMEPDTELLVSMVTSAERSGIFTIGGGVPRNNTQNAAPLIEIMNERLEIDGKPKFFSYGCRIAPDPLWLGHLSGCSYQEGMSWRKMDPHGNFAEIHSDATLIWPFLVRYLIDTIV